MTELLRPEDLKKITIDATTAKIQEELKLANKQAEVQRALRDAFMEREVHPEAKDRINEAVRRAAAHGFHEIQAFTFASSYCNDGGRRINNSDPEWPSSLEGFAKRAYDFFDKELRPLGYRLSVRVVDYPGGKPGDIGFFVRW